MDRDCCPLPQEEGVVKKRWEIGVPQMSVRELETTSPLIPKGRAGQLFPAPQAENWFGKCSALCGGFLGFHLPRPELNCSLACKKMNVVVSKSQADVWEITKLQNSQRFEVTVELLWLTQRQTESEGWIHTHENFLN